MIRSSCSLIRLFFSESLLSHSNLGVTGPLPLRARMRRALRWPLRLSQRLRRVLDAAGQQSSGSLLRVLLFDGASFSEVCIISSCTRKGIAKREPKRARTPLSLPFSKVAVGMYLLVSVHDPDPVPQQLWNRLLMAPVGDDKGNPRKSSFCLLFLPSPANRGAEAMP